MKSSLLLCRGWKGRQVSGQEILKQRKGSANKEQVFKVDPTKGPGVVLSLETMRSRKETGFMMRSGWKRRETEQVDLFSDCKNNLALYQHSVKFREIFGCSKERILHNSTIQRDHSSSSSLFLSRLLKLWRSHCVNLCFLFLSHNIITSGVLELAHTCSPESIHISVQL